MHMHAAVRMQYASNNLSNITTIVALIPFRLIASMVDSTSIQSGRQPRCNCVATIHLPV